MSSSDNVAQIPVQGNYTVQDILALQLDALTNMNLGIKRMEEMFKKVYGYGYERGTTYAFTLTVQNKLMIIDFIEPNRSRNIDQGLLNVPGTPVSRIILYNIGANLASFSTNRAFSSVDASAPLSAGAVFEIESEFPAIHTLHIVAPTGNTNVRVVLIV